MPQDNRAIDSPIQPCPCAARTTEIIAEGKNLTGTCEKVILVTRSMSGLVVRAAMKLAGAEGQVLGVVDGVQPAYGSPAAYPRMKAGFEGGMLTSNCLGPSGCDMTALRGNRTVPKLEHQPAYEQAAVKTWVTAAVTAVAGLRFKELKG